MTFHQWAVSQTIKFPVYLFWIERCSEFRKHSSSVVPTNNKYVSQGLGEDKNGRLVMGVKFM